ncbi:hypothetical protein RhiirA5_470214 [Rhizophagus irregularis]|uniref:Uncharacterized protein n=1 Tax=Rhizophagus irregularis TaxID=588596 RepID=A0A2N0NQB0_9GLOM|nr:hypothetical protein RhiirA5_470214 [Rhizophagus irregularis]
MELNCALIVKKSFGEERDESRKYCDTPVMELVETIQIEFPDAHLGLNRPLTFGISFGCICEEFNKWTNVCQIIICILTKLTFEVTADNQTFRLILETFFITEKDNNLKNFSGVTFDLTARKLVGNNPLQYSEITERIGDFFGSIFIDNEFIKFLREKLGTRAIVLLMENNYDQSQCLMQEFCQHVKDPFTRDDTEYNYILDIKEKAPLLLSRVNRKTKKIMKKNEWIKQEFNHTVKNISVPTQPIVAIAHGAIIYGLSKKSNGLNNNSVEDNMKNIDSSRVLKYTLGIDVDSLYGKSNDVEIHRFLALANRGIAIELDQTFSFNFEPEFNQKSENFAIYYTKNNNVQHCEVLLGGIKNHSSRNYCICKE